MCYPSRKTFVVVVIYLLLHLSRGRRTVVGGVDLWYEAHGPRYLFASNFFIHSGEINYND